MKNLIRAVYIFGVATCVISCDGTPKSLSADKYLSWVSSDERPFNKVKRIKNVDIKVRYLPAEYLTYKEFMTTDSVSYDSLLKAYQCGLAFQVSIQADKLDPTYGNLMYYNILSQEEILERTRYLNFSVADFISVEHNAEHYEPVLSHFEGFDALGNRLIFQIVFMIPEYNCGTPMANFNNVLLTFDDPFWDLGTNKFEFEKISLLSVPKLNL